MEKLINSFISTYAGDYQWPYLPSQNYRQDGECYYYPTIYNPMDYYSNLPTREDLQNTCKNEHFAKCQVQPYKDSAVHYQTPHAINPYNNLHCTCIKCMREMRCAEARVDLRKRYPFIYKPEDKQLTQMNEMMAKLQRDRFCTVYQNSYSKDPCRLYRYHNTVPCEEPRNKENISSLEDMPECFALQKPSNPLEFRKYSSANNTPTFKKGKGKQASKSIEVIERPWHSEYMDGISRVGRNIIVEKLHDPKSSDSHKHAHNTAC